MGPQVVPVEPYLRWDASVSRRFLSSVDRVEVHETREHAGATFFVVDVFLSLPETRLPAANAIVGGSATASASVEPEPESSATASHEARPSATAERAPTYRVERRYSSFKQLRRTLEEWVHEATPLCRCAYCVELVERLRFSWKQPSLLSKLVHTGDTRKRMLEAFVTDMVALARRAPTSSQSAASTTRPRRASACKVQAHVPSLLEAFLLDKVHQ